MKKLLFPLLLLTVLWTGCSNDDISASDLQGTWIAEQQDGEKLLTNDLFVHEFCSGQQLINAHRYNSSEGVEWVEDPCAYQVKDNVLYVNGTNAAGKIYSFEADIKLEGDVLNVQVTKFILDGKETTQRPYYTMNRSKENLYSSFINVWKGGPTTPGVTYEHDIYWEYYNDGRFDYYYYDEDLDKYVTKEDNQGRFFLYGNLLVSNYMNDIEQGTQGKESESWIISLEGEEYTQNGQRVIRIDTMKWIGYRTNGTFSFEMKLTDFSPRWLPG